MYRQLPCGPTTGPARLLPSGRNRTCWLKRTKTAKDHWKKTWLRQAPAKRLFGGQFHYLARPAFR